jgi:hypothetical protein
MAAIRFFASGFHWRQSYPAQQQLAADRTFDPENLPFSYYAGYPGTDLGVAGLFVLALPALPAALGLPMHSYPPHVSSLLGLWACFSTAFATKVILSGILD